MKKISECERCDRTGWVCEAHPFKPWSDSGSPKACGCGAAGDPCLDRNPSNEFVAPDTSEVIVEVYEAAGRHEARAEKGELSATTRARFLSMRCPDFSFRIVREMLFGMYIPSRLFYTSPHVSNANHNSPIESHFLKRKGDGAVTCRFAKP